MPLTDEIEGIFEHMTSGVPQSSTLGPLLFLMYINDMQYLNMFADDTEIMEEVGSKRDCEILRRHLGKMRQWSNKWLKIFNPRK